MWYTKRTASRFAVVVAVALVATGFTPSATGAPIPGMTFKLKVVLRQTPTSGRAPRAVTLMGHGQFAGGMGRVTIDTVDAPSPIRKGDFFIIRDSLNTFWARPADRRVRRMNAPLVNPLEGISERLTSGMGSPRSLKVVFDTISLNETVNGHATRHFRITADVVYPVGTRHVTQKVVIDQWLAVLPVRIMNPFGSRVRGLPDAPLANSMYREFIRTLAAANRVYGDAVTVRTETTTSYVYGPGLGEDISQTVDLTDLQPTEVDERLFELTAEYKLQRRASETPMRPPAAAPPRKPPTR
ncbi:MAG TPA: hypothetical protein VFO55_13465 [Gemmatimonadaceae bacterium]|nr:hypothetical protein [Gemmatimonadaceae bacterium]